MNVAGVISGRLDIAFVAGVPEPEGCRVETLPEQQIYVAMADQHPFANRQYVTWGALRDELFVVTADGYGPEVEGMLSRHVSTVGLPEKGSIRQVGREKIMNMVGRGFGLTRASASPVGVLYRDVKFGPGVADTEN